MEYDNTSQQITQTQIKLLLSDWLGNLRQGEEAGFVHKGKGGIRTSEESIADYLLGDVVGFDEKIHLKKTLQAARNLVSTISPEKVNVITGGSESFHGVENNGRETICLATDYFDENSLSKRDKSCIMLGLACHEAAHSAFTENEPKMALINSYPQKQQMLVKQIWNVLEDERIEYLLTDKSPGLSTLLAGTKRHYFKKYRNNVGKTGEEPTEPLPKLLNALMLAVRYPSELTEETVVENFDSLNKIRKALTPYPLTPEGACKKANEIMSIIKDMIKDELENQQDNKQSSSQEQQSSSQNQDKQQGNSSKQQNNNSGKSQNKSQSKQQPTPADIEQALEQALDSKQASNIIEAMAQDDEKGKDNRQGAKAASAIKNNTNGQKFVNEDDAELAGAGSGFDPKAYVFKPKGKPADYARVAASIRKYVPAMSKALACKSREREFFLDGLPSGKLNMNKLVSLQAGNTNIFTKKGISRCSAASICVLIDESGSMCGEKQQSARQAAILLNEAIKNIRTVNYYCYGYSDSLHIYCEAGKSSPWSLSEVDAYGGTPTGEAMRYAARRIRRRTSEPVLMLVLTDGSADSTEKVLRADEELRRQKFTVIGVGIQTPYVEHSFKDHMTIMDIAEMPVKLGKVARKYLSKTLVKSNEML